MCALLQRGLSRRAAIACLPFSSSAVNAQMTPVPNTGYNCDLALYSVPKANLLARSLQGKIAAEQQYRLVSSLAADQQSGRERGMSVYVWLLTLNSSYSRLAIAATTGGLCSSRFQL